MLLLFVLISVDISAQTGDLKLLDWQPISQLVTKKTNIIKAKFPVIDIHNHLVDLENTKHYLEEMHKAWVWKCLSLDANSKDGSNGERYLVSNDLGLDSAGFMTV